MNNPLKALIAVLLSTLFITTAWALDLDDAKSRGWVGEQPDGYLGVVNNAPGVDTLVREINHKRKQAYTEKADNAGVDLSIMEQRIGQRLIQRTPTGEYIRLPDGRWIQK